MSFRLERGDVQAEWLGALHLTHRGRGVLLGAPAGIAESLGPAVDALDAVVLLTGQLRTVEGRGNTPTRYVLSAAMYQRLLEAVK